MESKLVRATFCGATKDVLTLVISDCCLGEIELLSLFSAIIISV